jgi:hypothetical protein
LYGKVVDSAEEELDDPAATLQGSKGIGAKKRSLRYEILIYDSVDLLY